MYGPNSYDKIQERLKFFKQMRCNKILMKVFVDVSIAFEKLNGNHHKVLKLSKFAIKLHKSIKRYEGETFGKYLDIFPCMKPNEKLYIGQKMQQNRNIIELMNQNVIIKDGSSETMDLT